MSTALRPQLLDVTKPKLSFYEDALCRKKVLAWYTTALGIRVGIRFVSDFLSF